MDAHVRMASDSLEAVVAADLWAREAAGEWVRSYK
jgi:hypothetical protein